MNRQYICSDTTHLLCHLDANKCCICKDQREYTYNGLYENYKDGRLRCNTAKRWEYYCPFCKDLCSGTTVQNPNANYKYIADRSQKMKQMLSRLQEDIQIVENEIRLLDSYLESYFSHESQDNNRKRSHTEELNRETKKAKLDELVCQKRKIDDVMEEQLKRIKLL